MEEMAKNYNLTIRTTDGNNYNYDCVTFDNNHLALAITIDAGHVISFMLSYVQMFIVREL